MGDISRERQTLVDYVEINVSLFPLRSFVEKENTYSKEYYDLSSEFPPLERGVFTAFSEFLNKSLGESAYPEIISNAVSACGKNREKEK